MPHDILHLPVTDPVLIVALVMALVLLALLTAGVVAVVVLGDPPEPHWPPLPTSLPGR